MVSARSLCLPLALAMAIAAALMSSYILLFPYSRYLWVERYRDTPTFYNSSWSLQNCRIVFSLGGQIKAQTADEVVQRHRTLIEECRLQSKWIGAASFDSSVYSVAHLSPESPDTFWAYVHVQYGVSITGWVTAICLVAWLVTIWIGRRLMLQCIRAINSRGRRGFDILQSKEGTV
jgi:hypothetical protein